MFETREYDPTGRLIRRTLPGTVQAVGHQYDALGRLTATSTDGWATSTAYTYDSANRTTSVTQPAEGSVGTVTSLYTYDALGRVTAVDSGSAGSQTYAYNEFGWLASRTDSASGTTSYTYDLLGRPTTVDSPQSGLTTYTYDALGRVLTEENGSRLTSYTYDALGRQLSATSGTAVTAYGYDAVGNLLSVTDPEGNTTTFAYNALNRLISETNPLGHQRTYEYDPLGNLTARTDRNGRRIEYEWEFAYDGASNVRLLTERWLEGGAVVRTIAATYTPAGLLETIGDHESFYTYMYDALGRLETVSNAGTPGAPDVEIGYTYGLTNNRLSTTATVDGAVALINTYHYDDAGRVLRIDQTGGSSATDKRVDFSYDGFGRLTEIERFADLSGSAAVAQSAYTYDLSGRLGQLTHTAQDTTLADYTWTYDLHGRLITATSPDGAVDYTYDAEGQLLSADFSYQADESYTYDENGNRTNAGYVTDPGNFITNDGRYTYEYDNEGNRTRKSDTQGGSYVEYTWDHHNRLTGAAFYDGTGVLLQSLAYIYDVHDRRIARKHDQDGDGTVDEEQWFVYDNSLRGDGLDDLLLVTDAAGTVVRRHLHGPGVDQVLAEEDAAGTVQWMLADRQGTIRDVAVYDAVTDTTVVVNHVTYGAFGEIRSQTAAGAGLFFAYTGREWDEALGLYYYRARWYDAGLGRFVSEDPLGFAAGDLNLQRYVGNSPTNATDPSGQFEWETTFEIFLQRYGEEGLQLFSWATRIGWSVEQRNYWHHDWYLEDGRKVIGIRTGDYAGFAERSDGNAAAQLIEALRSLYAREAEKERQRLEYDFILGEDFETASSWTRGYRFFAAVGLNSWIGSGIKKVENAWTGETILAEKLGGWDRAKLATIGSLETLLTAVPLGKGVTAAGGKLGLGTVGSAVVRKALAQDILLGFGETATRRLVQSRVGQAFVRAYGKVHASKVGRAYEKFSRSKWNNWGKEVGGEAAEAMAANSVVISAARGTGQATRTLANPESIGTFIRGVRARIRLGSRFEPFYKAAQRDVIRARTQQVNVLKDVADYSGRVRYLHESGSSTFNHGTGEIIIRQHAFYEPGGVKSVFLHEVAHSRLPITATEYEVDMEAVNIANEFFGNSDDIILPFTN